MNDPNIFQQDSLNPPQQTKKLSEIDSHQALDDSITTLQT
jgi:hypothetical protein